ncbi:MAG: DUF4168 domain-containing protein [Rhodospirillaceae bacterium]|jgi:hypothetical protein|nr:DUF4168 domain-containing protein [Rhodospirillaceae bacterium]
MIHLTLRRARLLGAAALFPLAALTMAPANAGSVAPANAVTGVELAQAQAAPAAVDEAQLEIFVTAAKAIVALRRQYEPRLAAAGSQAEADALIQEARGLMATAITDAGISVDNYMAIANTAQTDPALRKRIETAVGATR